MKTTAAKTYAKSLARHIDGHTSVAARRAARDAAGLPRCDRRPVCVIPGASAPTCEGAGYYFTTPSGKTVVHHPNAYGYRTLYHCSTRRVEVGARWLAVRGLAFAGPVSL
jgi:hypothetical protein